MACEGFTPASVTPETLMFRDRASGVKVQGLKGQVLKFKGSSLEERFGVRVLALMLGG